MAAAFQVWTAAIRGTVFQLTGRGCVLAVALTALGNASAGAAGDPSVAAAGTVATIAGPGFCDGEARLDPLSTAVRALAVDAEGRLFFDTGPRGAGVVARVDGYGRAGRLVTGVPAGPDGGGAGLATPTAPAPGRLVPDGQGGVIVSTGASLIDIDANNNRTVIAGDGAAVAGQAGAGASGDGGPAAAARFGSVRSLASDESGNLFLADQAERGSGRVRLRFINRGTAPISFYSGTPEQVTVLPGAIAAVAGVTGRDGPGDGGSALGATFQGAPPALAAASGRLYVALFTPRAAAPRGDARILLINLRGTPLRAHGLTIPAGGVGTVARGTGDDASVGMAAASVPAFSYLPGIVADGEGSLFLADEWHHRIRRVDPAGVIATVAGSKTGRADDSGFNGNDRPAVGALLNRPYDVKIGPGRRLYISDQLNGEIRFVDAAGTIRAARGAGVALSWRCSPPSELPQPGGATGVAADWSGRVFLALASRHEVKRLDPSGALVTVAGGPLTGVTCPGPHGCWEPGEGGSATTVRLDRPSTIAVNRRGDLYILDSAKPRVWYANLGADAVTVHGVTVAAGAIRTIAGDGQEGLAGDGGPALRGRLASPGGGAAFEPLSQGPRTDYEGSPDVINGPSGSVTGLDSLAVDDAGNLFIADLGNHRVRLVDRSGTISTLAGTGAPDAAALCCTDPTGVAVDPAGNLLVADLGIDGAGSGTPHPRIWGFNRGTRAITLLGRRMAPGAVEPVAGTGSYGESGDGGPALSAELLATQGLTVGRRGDLYFAEESDVRRVDSGGMISTVLGTGQLGFNGDGLLGRLTDLNYPAGLALDRCGNLLVADLGGDRLRRLNLVPPCAPPVATNPAPPTQRAATIIAVLGFLAVVSGGWLQSRRLRRGRAAAE